MTKLSVPDLTSGSVLELARERFCQIEEADLGHGDTARIQVAHATDVLYLPSALLKGQSLQIVEGRFIPIEAVFDSFTVEFAKQQLTMNGATIYDKEFETDEYEDDVCILGNVFSRNFTHWHEELMKVVVIERCGIECKYVLAALPSFAKELIILMGIPEDRLLEINRPTIFRRALFTTPVSYRNLSAHPGVLYALREIFFQINVTDQPFFGRKLWLNRNKQTRLGRTLVNFEEVNKCLEEFDVKTLDMGALPIRTQIAVARNLEVISGIHGSQFVHSQLMATDSVVIECFSPFYLNPTYTEIYRVLCHRYSQISSTNTPVFPYRYGVDVEVDCSQLRLALENSSRSRHF